MSQTRIICNNCGFPMCYCKCKGESKMNCPICNKPIDKHEAGRNTDECVGSVVGFNKVQEESRIVNNNCLYISGVAYDYPHYSTDANEALPLWQKRWELDKLEGGYLINVMQTFDEEILCNEFPLAVCQATLLENS